MTLFRASATLRGFPGSEMLSASSNQRLHFVARRLNIAIVPLLLVFASIVGSEIAVVLS